MMDIGLKREELKALRNYFTLGKDLVPSKTYNNTPAFCLLYMDLEQFMYDRGLPLNVPYLSPIEFVNVYWSE